MSRRVNKFIIFGVIIFTIFFAARLFLATAYVFPVLMYHSIDKNPGNSKIIVTPQDFEAQMRYLKSHGVKVITLEELIDLIKANKRLPRKTVAITFDDGYENNYTYAYPILKKNNFPATIFVIVDSIGKNGYMTEEQLKELHLNKIDIGSHSLTHRWLPKVKEEDLIKEIFDSKKILENFFRVKFFCYPAGGFNEKVKAIVKSAGYSGACTTDPGRRFSNCDIFALKRVRVSGGKNNLLVFRLKISGYHTWIKEHRDED